MKKQTKSIYKAINFLVLTLLLISVSNKGQVISNYGLKGGLIISKLTMSQYESEAFSYEPDREYKFLSIDIGIFTEFFNSETFCISTEIHYNIKGEENYQDFEVLQPNDQNNGFEYKKLNDRFHYISFQILPRWKFMVNSSDKLYLFGGPKMDLRVANSKSGGDEEIKLNNGVFEAGFTVGVGNEIWELLSIEFRYEYNFSNVYIITYGNEVITRKNNSFDLLVGLSLKKLAKIL